MGFCYSADVFPFSAAIFSSTPRIGTSPCSPSSGISPYIARSVAVFTSLVALVIGRRAVHFQLKNQIAILVSVEVYPGLYL